MPFVQFIDQVEPLEIANIYCIGRNYAKHAAELGNTVSESPIVFMKPTSSVIHEGEAIRLPSFSSNIHYEAELVVAIGSSAKGLEQERALSCVAGYGVGLDLTARDAQEEAKRKGLPWTLCKGFATSCCLSDFVSATAIPDPQKAQFTLDISGERRQTGDTSFMLFTVAHLISYLSDVFTLQRGDLIMTGTPEGVGPIRPGDELALTLMDRVRARFHVA